MADHLIRKAAASDIGELADIEKRSFSDPWPIYMITDDVFGSGFGTEVYVLEVRGKVAGYYYYYPASDDLANFAVAPEYRRRGYGRILLMHCIQYARSLNKEYLYLEVRESNVPARCLYTSCGFRIINVRKDYYSDPEEDAIVMRLSIRNIYENTGY